jgi:hypothetical protein
MLKSDRTVIKSYLKKSLGDLRLKYTGLISLDKAHPDLHIDINKVKEELNSVDAILKNVNIM